MVEKERIDKVMQLEGMNSAVFAAAIGIQGSTLSHILNGRNNPSLSVLQSILNRFPNISPEWLIMGQGPMDRTTKQSQAPTLFDSIDETISKSVSSESILLEKNTSTFSPIQQKQTTVTENSVNPTHDLSRPPIISAFEGTQRSVRKIIVYYTDNTFQEFQ